MYLKDEHYICQRAANAIISEVGPYRVSTDALQAINQFLDEFIVLLLACSLSLDLSNIKSVVFNLLPSTLGKNAVVEAELEVKTFITDSESIDYDVYERMRNMKVDAFPLNEAIPLLREKCFEYCTLADKEDQLYMQRSMQQRKNRSGTQIEQTIIISPIVAIYVTTIMEHIGEYLLTAVAMSAEHEDTDYIRVKEVFLALVDDVQLGNVFHKMELRKKLEKRATVSYNASLRQSSHLSVLTFCRNNDNKKNSSLIQHPIYYKEDSLSNINFDDLVIDYFSEEKQRKSTYSTNSVKLTKSKPSVSIPHRPYSSLSHNSGSSNVRKSTFHLFKDQRNTLHNNVLPRASNISPLNQYKSTEEDEEYADGTPPLLDFDELIRSGETVKVSLTPNRLRSIEIRDQTKDDILPTPTWERRSNISASPRLSAVNYSRPSSPLSQKLNHSEKLSTNICNLPSTLSSLSSSSSSSTLSSPSSETNDHDLAEQRTIQSNIQMEVPKLGTARYQHTPSSPLSKQSFTMNNQVEHHKKTPLLNASTIPAISKATIHIVPETDLDAGADRNIKINTLSTQTEHNNFDKNNNNHSATTSRATKKKLTPLSRLSASTTAEYNNQSILSSSTFSTNSTNISYLNKSYSSTSLKSSHSSIAEARKEPIHTNPNNVSETVLPQQQSATTEVERLTVADTPASSSSITFKRSSSARTTTTAKITIQESPKFRLSKSSSTSNISTATSAVTINAYGSLLRRSSASNRKSRENLRKMKEEKEQKPQQEHTDQRATEKSKPATNLTKLSEHQHEQQQKAIQTSFNVREELLTDVRSTKRDSAPSSLKIATVGSQNGEAKVDNRVSTVIKFTEEPQQVTDGKPMIQANNKEKDKERNDPSATIERNDNAALQTKASATFLVPKKMATLSPERPSSLVAKRASMVGNSRRRSMHENFATEKYYSQQQKQQQKDMNEILRQRQSSVSVSIKQWDDILKTGEWQQQQQQQQRQQQQQSIAVANMERPATHHRRSVLRQLRQLQEQQGRDTVNLDIASSSNVDINKSERINSSGDLNSSSAVLDKVLKFERASSMEPYNSGTSYTPRRERFLYLQQEPSLIERKTIHNLAIKKKAKIGIDQAVQTDSKLVNLMNKDEEQGKEGEFKRHVEGESDEEWFLEDFIWDEQEESTIVEWLLGE
ncbi:hypothetical protein BDF20DRAFT_833899 [Mycotypha africana]|uniref:uncharacterized protein n=1 Tax=Mycotypha africana TaxID=64632 RepID=UPI0022FFFACF|nr:uncharacterized protein BDF20DRAFT_833899 [Mycotypha africana]KAI8984389.1 hypothetical protein BDF20DRAFT_833899 [Mycotypha africana]